MYHTHNQSNIRHNYSSYTYDEGDGDLLTNPSDDRAVSFPVYSVRAELHQYRRRYNCTLHRETTFLRFESYLPQHGRYRCLTREVYRHRPHDVLHGGKKDTCVKKYVIHKTTGHRTEWRGECSAYIVIRYGFNFF